MDKIPLSEMLDQLREELLQARGKGADSELKFGIEEAEIELQLATTKAGEGGGGVKFWVYNADAKVKASEVKTQRLKLKLKPVTPQGPLQVSSGRSKPE